MKSPIAKLAIAIAVTTIATTGTANGAFAQSAPPNSQWNALFDRIIRLEANVKNLAPGGGAPAGGGYTQTRNNDQMRQLLNEVRQMRQQLQSMDARLRRLEHNRGRSGALKPKRPTHNQNSFAQNDLEQYNNNGEPKIFVEIDKPGSQPVLSQGVPVAPIARAPENWQTATANPPGNNLPTTPSYTNNGQPSAVPFEIKNPARNTTGSGGLTGGIVRTTLDGNQATQQSVAKKLYERSRSNLLARRYGAAESGFKSFLNKYASHDLASGAQFMLGETYYVQRNWRLAAQSYLKGYRKYPNGNRAGDTLFKLGMSLGKLGQKTQSCGAFETVVTKYKSSGNVASRARKEMKSARC